MSPAGDATTRLRLMELANRFAHPRGMGKSKFYGVARGRTPGVYTTWDEAKVQVNAFKGAVHKSFGTFAAGAYTRPLLSST
jgi:hypothetical protein